MVVVVVDRREGGGELIPLIFHMPRRAHTATDVLRANSICEQKRFLCMYTDVLEFTGGCCLV